MISHALDPVFLLFGAAALAVLICAALGINGLPAKPPEPVAPPAPLRPAVPAAPVPRRFGYGAAAYGEDPFNLPAPPPPTALSPMARASGSGDLAIGALAGIGLGFTAAQVALLNADAPFVLRDASPDCAPIAADAAPASAADCGSACGAD